MSTIKLTRAQRRRMKKLVDEVDIVSQADRRFFERFPHRQHRVRLSSSDEIEQAEIAGGKRMTIPPGFKALTVVRNIAPGFRIRLLLPASEGQEMDVGEAAAEAIFAAVATPQVREVEAELLRLAREAGGA